MGAVQAGGSVLGTLTYAYDAAGNRTVMGGSLARTGVPTPVPNATYDAGNRQLTFGDKTLTYDANGNLLSITDPTGTTTYTWDARNRLVGLSGPGTTASFTYDALGRRTAKTIGGQATQYLYDGLDIVQEATGGQSVPYLRSQNIDEPWVRNGTEYYLADALGSVLGLTDATGALVTRYVYDPFGRTSVEGTASSNPFQYTGRENDGTGLYYYRARYYNPALARLLSEDPLYSPVFPGSKCGPGNAPSPSRYLEIDPGLALLMAFRLYAAVDSMAVNPQLMHLYTYGDNDPVTKTDPLGLIAGPQSPGCDWPARPLELQSPCAKSCCTEHDRCYQEASGWCDQNSWKEYFKRTKVHPECDACNKAAVRCIWSTRGGGGGGRKDRCPPPRAPVVPSGP